MLPPALPLNAAAWFISILKKTSVHILVPSGLPKNGTVLTKYGLLVLAGITQLITVLLADRIHHHEYIRSLKPLVS